MRPFVWILLAAGLTTAFLASPAYAIRFTGADFQLQTVKRNDQTAISGLAFRGRMESIDLPVGLMFLPTIERWRDKNTIGFVGIESSQRDLALGMDAAYQIQLGAWSPYLGLGLTSHFIQSEASAPQLGLPRAEDSLTKIGPNFLLGVDMPGASGVRSYMEAKFQYISDYEQLKLNWGISVAF